MDQVKTPSLQGKEDVIVAKNYHSLVNIVSPFDAPTNKDMHSNHFLTLAGLAPRLQAQGLPKQQGQQNSQPLCKYPALFCYPAELAILIHLEIGTGVPVETRSFACALSAFI